MRLQGGKVYLTEQNRDILNTFVNEKYIVSPRLYVFMYLIGQKNVGQNFRRTKIFVGQNFRHL